MTRMVTPLDFELRVPETVLDDLRLRLERTRWPDEAPDGTPWQYGTDLRSLRDLVAYWRHGFDWRVQEARLNAFKQYTAPVAGIDLHFIHEPGIGPSPLPLVLSHGWPGSVWEFHKLIPLLTDPARFGADAADVFTIVAPSLPGYPLSFRPDQPRFSQVAIGDAFATLMRDVLGYERFAAQGGDWGSFISAALGLNYPENVIGVHLNLLPLRRDPAAMARRPGPEEPEMTAFRAELDYWLREETGYSTIQGTKPQTLAYALTDSPVGLAAWILEKFRTWSDCGGDVDSVFSRDELLTNIMVYWATGAIGSSFWPYYARIHEGWPLPDGAYVSAPTAYLAFPREIYRPPRSLAEPTFNIQRWTSTSRGGHFAALEQPETLAKDLREFFRPHRTPST